MGEAVFRNDLDNFVTELGDLLIHEGHRLAAEKAAARIFGADRAYLVLNGTSTSDKIALTALVAPGDLVLFDRNNHKAAHHGVLLLGGCISVYLQTQRNAHGMIGPIDFDALDEARIRASIRDHPLVVDRKACQRKRPFRVAVIEQCTYDAQLLVRKLGSLCDYILFDEAWAGFTKFHPLLRGRFAMGVDRLDAESPGMIATQSTHKQLAGFSQTSQIHVKDALPTCEEFLQGYRSIDEACVLVDAYLPGMTGLELLRQLDSQAHRLPAIMITGSSDIPMVVNAMKAGAIDFIEKPVHSQDLLQSVARALDQGRDSNKLAIWRERAAQHIAELTPRQREVMERVLAGQPSKNIAAELHISQRTVENHRASIMKKTGSKSLPALARLAIAASAVTRDEWRLPTRSTES